MLMRNGRGRAGFVFPQESEFRNVWPADIGLQD
jgi:hypothetical protein